MGLIILGAENLASDQADQKPNTYKRGKEAEQLRKQWIELIDLPDDYFKVVFHNYQKFPADEWNAIKSALPVGKFNNYLAEVDMSSCVGVKEVSYRAFMYARQLKKVYFPDGITTIGEEAFAYTENLQLSELPDSIETFEKSCFGSSGLSISKLPKNTKTIKEKAFDFSNVTISKLPETLETVEKAFVQCQGITNIEIACATLPMSIFAQCFSLKKAWLRSTCTTIHAEQHHYPFYACPQDLEIYAEPAAKLDGWETYYNWTGWAHGEEVKKEVTVTFNQTTSPF